MKFRDPALCNNTSASSSRRPLRFLHHTPKDVSHLVSQDTGAFSDFECRSLRHLSDIASFHCCSTSCYDIRQLTNISTLTKLDIYLADADIDQPNPRRYLPSLPLVPEP